MQQNFRVSWPVENRKSPNLNLEINRNGKQESGNRKKIKQNWNYVDIHLFYRLLCITLCFFSGIQFPVSAFQNCSIPASQEMSSTI
jgi:hypothetical protein